MTLDKRAPSPTPDAPSYRAFPHWFALAAAVFTLGLLYVGGSVTTYRVGLAVPDWPTTFGINMFLYDFWNAPFGVRVEHTHRLYGAAVGLCTLLLAAWLLVFDRRLWMKGMAVLAVVAVIAQGILGGTRVTQMSTVLAASHGVMGQAFFGLLAAMCVWTGRDWLSRSEPRTDAHGMRPLAWALFFLLGSQIVVGSWLRHFGTWPALVGHAALAAAVWIAAAMVVVRVERNRSSLPFLVGSARALGILAVVQIALGVVSLIYLLPFDGMPRPVSFYQAVMRTGHQTNGALLLAAVVVVTLRSVRHLTGTTLPAATVATEESARPGERVALTREAIA